MTYKDAPWHAHIYFSPEQRRAAVALRDRFKARLDGGDEPRILFVGPLRDGPVGPHPMPQFELHFPEASRSGVTAMIEASGLTALLHPLTDDDLADHTTLAYWIGAPLALDLSVLDPPGENKGVARYGEADF